MRPHRSLWSVALATAGALASSAAAIVACATFSAVDTAPLADGGPDASAPDAAPDPGATDAAASGFCGLHPNAELCSDFDGTKVTEGWRVDTVGGTLMADETLFHSPPRSLRATLPPTPAATSARLVHDIPLSAKRARLSLAFRRGKGVLGQGSQISIAEIYCASPGVSEGIFLYLENASFDLHVHVRANGGDTIDILPPLAPTDWTVLVLDAHLDSTLPTVDVTIGGTAAKQYPLAAACLNAPTFEVRAGLSTFSSASAEAFIDDIVYEINPR